MGDVSRVSEYGSSTILSPGCGFNFQGIDVDDNNCHIVVDVDKAKVLRLSPNGRSKFPKVDLVAGGVKGTSKAQFQSGLKGSIGEGPNHSNFSQQSSVRIRSKFRNFR